MRKVTKKNEIPLRMIESEAIERRLNRFNNKDISAKTVKKLSKLLPWLNSLSSRTVTLRMVMNRIYNDIDYFMEHEIAKAIVCSKGCAHCCKVPVQVTLMEADYISQMTGLTINRVVNSRLEMPKSVDTYCPLLDQGTGTCSVYKFRPLACRLFATFDSWKFCETSDQGHYIHCFENQPLFKDVHQILIVNSKGAGDNVGLAAVAEIRDWFK